MLKKEITYKTYDGEVRTREFAFNLNSTELIKLDGEFGGFEDVVKAATDTNDVGTIMTILERIISASYGVIEDNGERFRKSVDLSNAFVQSPAYEALFIELLTDGEGEKAGEFISGLVSGAVKGMEQMKNPSNRHPKH